MVGWFGSLPLNSSRCKCSKSGITNEGSTWWKQTSYCSCLLGRSWCPWRTRRERNQGNNCCYYNLLPRWVVGHQGRLLCCCPGTSGLCGRRRLPSPSQQESSLRNVHVQVFLFLREKIIERVTFFLFALLSWAAAQALFLIASPNPFVQGPPGLPGRHGEQGIKGDTGQPGKDVRQSLKEQLREGGLGIVQCQSKKEPYFFSALQSARHRKLPPPILRGESPLQRGD